MDLIILVVLIVIVVCIFKKFSSFIYSIAILDILFRILTFFKSQIPSKYVVYSFFDKNIPSSIPGILATYSTGVLYTVLLWLYVIAMVIFEYYIIHTLIRRK